MLTVRRFATTIFRSLPRPRAAPASAGVNRWTSQGPDGGSAYAITVDPSNPSIVYAGTYFAGVFRSDDGGSHWRALNSGTSYIATIALDPSRTATVYAAGAGFFKSTDGGLSWVTLMDGVPPYGQIVADLAIDASAPDTIYAATLDGVYKSVDGGCTWAAMNAGLPESDGIFYTNSITIDPSNPSILYLGSNFIGAFKSLDAGVSWFSISVGPPLSDDVHDDRPGHAIEALGREQLLHSGPRRRQRNDHEERGRRAELAALQRRPAERLLRIGPPGSELADHPLGAGQSRRLSQR